MNSRRSQADDLRCVIGQCVEEQILSQFAIHGNTSWTPHRLSVTALLWSWSSKAALTQRFREARGIAESLLQTDLPQHWQGFLKKLRADHSSLKQTMMQTLRKQSQEISERHQIVEGRPLLAVDGTRLELPRTRDNEQTYGTMQHPGQNRSRPTLWLTLVWDVGSRLPWDWRRGPTDSSERQHFLEMIDALPAHSIVTADAGFQGYDLWRLMLERGHDFVIRVGGQVHLLHEYWDVTLAEDLVYLWPARAQQRQLPPVKLRLLRVETEEEPVYLVTSILSSRKLPPAKVAEIYRQRWGIELFFREHKQTFERDRLRSHSARNVPVELDWSLLGLWIVKLLGTRRLLQHQRRPEELSVNGALQAIRDEMVTLRPSPDKQLLVRLAAVKDDGYFRRNKRSRNYPRKKKRRKPAGPPKIHIMNDQQRNQLKQMKLRR